MEELSKNKGRIAEEWSRKSRRVVEGLRKRSKKGIKKSPLTAMILLSFLDVPTHFGLTCFSCVRSTRTEVAEAVFEPPLSTFFRFGHRSPYFSSFVSNGSPMSSRTNMQLSWHRPQKPDGPPYVTVDISSSPMGDTKQHSEM